MDTLEFFQAVLPDTGPYVLAVFRPGEKAPGHKQVNSLEELARHALAYDQKGYSVYHCCSAGTPTKRRPNEDSLDWHAKALWLDLDCGADKDYPDQKTALKALQAFCKHYHVPVPTIINSGYGLHGYWVLDKPVTHSEWFPVAVAVKDAAITFGLKLDAKVTADAARILRPVGTHNRKNPDKPREVKLAYRANPLTLAQIVDALQEFVSTSRVASPDNNLNDDLTAHVPVSLPVSIRLVADHCAQVAKMRDTRGDVGYEHWRGVIGLCTHSVEGIEAAREWSEERAATGHEQTDVDTRYRTWNAGPSTCKFFASANPEGCNNCKHKGEITSPIQLGRIEPEPSQERLVDAVINGESVKVEVPPICRGYIWDDKTNQLARIMTGKDDMKEVHPFSKTLFYITHRVKREDGSFAIGIRSHLVDGRVRDFMIDTGLLASPTKLAEELGHKGELLPTNTKHANEHMTAYLRDNLEDIKRRAMELSTYTSFGWKDDLDAFLIGDRLYRSDGTKQSVLVGGYAANVLDHFPEPRGSLEEYATAVNSVYALPHMEPMQYAFCSGFGSILTALCEGDYRGSLCALVSGTSGRGKTTVAKAALYAFGAAEKMTITAQDTKNKRWATLGAYSSLPVLLDEFGMIEPKELSDLAYSVALGTERGRLIAKGGAVQMAVRAEWWLSPYLTGNDDFHGRLAQHNANSQAEAMRLVQIRVDEYNIPILPDGVVDMALGRMRQNQGRAGEAFIHYVVTHRREVNDMIAEVTREVCGQIDGPKYRFYRNHTICTLVAAKILIKLSVVQFNYEQLFNFAVQLIRKICDDVSESNTVSPDNAIGDMINEMSPRIMRTAEYRDSRDTRGREIDIKAPNYQALAGRLILGNPVRKDEYAGRLYLIKKEVKNWCLKNRIDYTSLAAYAKQKGFLIAEGERFNLTRGTELPTVQVTCLVLDHHAIEGAVPKLVLHTNPAVVDTPKDVSV